MKHVPDFVKGAPNVYRTRDYIVKQVIGIKIDWFALETNRDHSVVFEIASKYCILDSYVDHDGYSISSEGFLPTVVDIMVI